MNLNVKFCGILMKSPIVAASGTFGYGIEYKNYLDLNKLGAISVKGLSLMPSEGNKGVRIAETPSGILNCIGLENPGAEYFINKILPDLKKYDVPVIANIFGKTKEEYGKVARALTVEGVSALEVNISCPNIKEGGVAFGTNPLSAAEITKEVKRNTHLPVIMKLSPNVTDIAIIAKAVENAGADAISLINTLLGISIDLRTRRPVLGNITGGLSGPAIKPVALRMVWQVRNAVNIPICGMGGIMTGKDAAEFFIAGSDIVQVGTANLINPDAIMRITDELNAWGDSQGIKNINELVNTLNF